MRVTAASALLRARRTRTTSAESRETTRTARAGQPIATCRMELTDACSPFRTRGSTAPSIGGELGIVERVEREQRHALVVGARPSLAVLEPEEGVPLEDHL